MKKLKKVIPVIIAFIIGISTTVTAATVFNSKDITYNSDKTTKTNVKDSLDELYSKIGNTGECPEGKWCYNTPMTIADKVKLGDYISMTPTSTSYILPSNLSGCDGTNNTCIQNTINPSELNLWRVIRKNSDGTIDMISEYMSSNNINLYGRTGFINYIKALNTIAKQYTDEKHVVRTRYVGYSNQTEVITDTSMIDKTTKPWEKTGSLDPTFICNENTRMCNQFESIGGGDTITSEDLFIIKQVLGTVHTVSTTGVEGYGYLIAGRMYSFGAYGTENWEFRGRRVMEASRENSTNGFGSVELILNKESGERMEKRGSGGIRPIVTLDSNSNIKAGVGTKQSPYTLK